MTSEPPSSPHANKWIRTLALLLLAGLVAVGLEPAQAATPTVYVSASAPGPVHDGTSWAKSFTSIQSAIDAAATAGGAEVWVSRGVYRENLTLKSNVAIYGGFAGSESAFADRDLKKYRCVITSRSGAVTVRMDSVTSAVLDGFTVTGCSSSNGAGILCRQLDASSRLANCVVSGNWGLMYGLAGIRCDAASPQILNCIVSGNDTGGGLLAYNTSAPLVVGCTISDNGGNNGGAVVGNSGGLRLVNSIVANTSNGQGVYGVDSVESCLFNNNDGGNGVVAGGGNFFASPAFVMDGAGMTTGTWTADPVYDAVSRATRFYDARAALVPGALVGRTVQPYEGDWLQGAILDNTTTSVLVAGDFSQIVLVGDRWRLADYHLTNGSKALDSGTTATTAAFDFEGDPRPGGDALVEIGADEASDSYTPQLDTFPPTSSVSPLSEVTTATVFNISWTAQDADSGVREVSLFYRRNGGSWLPWGGVLSQSPVQFDAAATGGDGHYEFYTVATDNLGNVEVAPVGADARTLVATSFSGSRIYVNVAATGGRTGQNWTDALNELSLALSLAAAYHVPEIWVAGGRYHGQITFHSNVGLYGGFAGIETSLAQRDLKANRCIIDGGGLGNTITMVDVSGAVLDGFTVTGGRTTDLAAPGAGISCRNATSSSIANCIISGNQSSWYGGGISCIDAAPAIENCIISGNDAYEGGGLYVTGMRAPAVVNCTFSHNHGWSKCAVVDASGLLTPLNTIFSYNQGGVALSGVAGANYCLFYGNSGGDGIPVSGNNIFAPPSFVMEGEDAIGGVWTEDPVYDAATHTTLLQDANAGLIPGALAGRMVQLYTGSWVQAAVLDNTATGVRVAGNYAGNAFGGDPWRVVDYHLTDGSKALDRGQVASCPASDFEGDPRPGTDAQSDIGADEAPAAFTPQSDTAPPVSSAGPLPAVSASSSFDVPWTAFDLESGLGEVSLYYRRNGNAWALYGDPVTSGPVHFDSATTGGDGLYEFYTVAVDNAGNTEAIPAGPDAAIRVITSYSGSRIYVDAAARGAQSGLTWSDAFSRVQPALELAVAFGIPEIWVARGVYHENLSLVSGVALYGGFAGNETALAQRQLKANRCLIVASQAGNTVTIEGVSNARLDGFTITGGVAASASGFGAGIRCRNLDNSCRIANCIVSGNQTLWYGGGIGCASAAPVIENCLITGNTASSEGAGIFVEGTRAPLFVNCTIAGNQCYSASALSDDTGLVQLKNTIIAGNQGGQVVRTTGAVTSCLFYNNPGGNGITLGGGNIAGNPRFVMDGAGATTGTWSAGPVYDAGSGTTRFYDASASLAPGTLAGWLLQPSLGNLRQVVVLDNTTTSVLVAGDASGYAASGSFWKLADYHLTFGSAAVDAGSAAGAPAIDMEGAPRPVDIVAHGAEATGAEFDLGALEAQPAPRARLAVSGRPVDFGSQATGAGPTAPKVLIVVNDGFTPLAFSGPGIALAGADAADFMITNSPALTPLAAGATRPVLITFAPSLVGSKTAQLRVTTSDTEAPLLTAELSGVGTFDAPRILSGPLPVAVNPGGSVSFSVTVSGSTPLDFQWMKDGIPLSDGGRIMGADTATLGLAGVTMADAGLYRCVVANASGQATSTQARLTVNPTLTVASAHGLPMPAAGSHTYTTGSLVQASLSGSPELDTTGTTRYLATGWSGTGSVPASGLTTSTQFILAQDSALTWQWKTQYRLTATASPADGGRVTFSDGLTTATGTWHDAATTATLKAIPATGWGFGGWAGDGSTTATSISLGMKKPRSVTATFLLKPVITRHPTNLAASPGATITLTVVAAGSAPLSYQWWKDGGRLGEGGRIAGATAASLVISSAQESDEGTYYCVVGNAVGSAQSQSATLDIEDPPQITQQPADQTVNPGVPVSFSVGASSTLPLTYLWRKNGIPLSNGGPIGGVATATLVISGARESDEGAYSCMVSNSAGSLVSDAATLRVNDPPLIQTQPGSLTLAPGATANFSVTGSGTPALAYLWKKNGASLANGGRVTGANTASLTLSAVTMADAGYYTCQVTNIAGSATSNPARLTISPTLTVSSAHGVPTPAMGTNVLTTGSLVNARVDGSPVTDTTGTTRWLCTGWSGTGSVPPTGTASQVSFVINKDSALAWLWKTQYKLTATANPPEGGRVTLDDGQTTATDSWHDGGQSIAIAAVPAAGWAFGGWSGAASGSATTASVTMNGPRTVSASFLRLPVITQQPAGLTINPGASASLNVVAAGAPALSYQWRKNGVNLSNGGTLSGATTANLVLSAVQYGDAGLYTCQVTNPVGQVVSSAARLSVNPSLTIASAWGSPSPPVGLQYLTTGTLLTASVPAPIVTDSAGTTRQVCTGWTATGAAPASGSASSVTFTLDRPTAINWVWKTQYRLTAQSAPTTSGTVTLADGVTAADGWYDAGSSLTLRAVAGKGSRFSFWRGDVSGGMNPVSLPVMDRPRSVWAQFDNMKNGACDWWHYR